MARECKRKRDGRRFGRPERLADMVISTGVNTWVIPPWFTETNRRSDLELWKKNAINFQTHMSLRSCFEVTNVADFYFSSSDGKVGLDDFPSCVPPLPVCFVEYACNLRPEEPSRVGWFVICQDVNTSELNGDVEPINDARWYVDLILLLQLRDGRVCYPGVRHSWGITADGSLCSDMNVRCAAPGSEHWGDYIFDNFYSLVFPALLAFSFANCKNVVLAPHDPDPAVNRERRKGGLKPFVRYHTIDIEPMKRVLRDEGGVESHGLKKALHIVRGHFARYSEDRPLFGKYPGTFWMPAHVRGSIKEGVVVSDYDVKPPAPEGA